MLEQLEEVLHAGLRDDLHPPHRAETGERAAYAVLPLGIPETVYRRATADLDAVDLRLLAREGDWVSVRQLLAPPFSVLKMDFGTIHRGVANQGDSDRVLFWISVKRGGELLPPEPAVQAIPAPTQG